MKPCREHYCEDCGDQLIHQGGRHIDESASPFGQWVHDCLPREFTAGDVDLYLRHWRPEMTLLRWIEHKAPGQKYKSPQRQALADFDSIIRHAVTCVSSPLKLDPRSGVFVVYSRFANGEPVDALVQRLSDQEVSKPLDASNLGDWLTGGLLRRRTRR